MYYLSQRAVSTERGADLQEGSMYSQGLSAIALCEAYGMTSDPSLKQIAQSAVACTYQMPTSSSGTIERPSVSFGQSAPVSSARVGMTSGK